MTEFVGTTTIHGQAFDHFHSKDFRDNTTYNEYYFNPQSHEVEWINSDGSPLWWKVLHGFQEETFDDADFIIDSCHASASLPTHSEDHKHELPW